MVEPTVDNLQKQTDLELVCEGAPAYLLMIDSLLADNPGNRGLLLTATQSYCSYTTALTACGRTERAIQLSNKAKDYGLILLTACLPRDREKGYSLDELRVALASCSKSDVPSLFWGGYGWALWLQYQAGSPASLTGLAKVEKIMERVQQLDEEYYHGAAHLFLGSYYGSRPSMLGGNPAESRAHFERALAIGDHQFLPAQVAFAETYARTVFDRDLFEQLLQEVVDFPLQSKPDLALANQVAKKKAGQLLADVDRYF
ncbi:MAG: TRAP transporter TatT component family protein [Proteobacteria bacterium]|nr:TRAP transporter TatT component family protein [Pseudomonadota bacterium]MBU4295477.1 TRAP transporter TatT component family protein [Pseudomonadota bacterium]MCG2747664.1 TRAP transporter TatT component family protein [Desulfobulbaceae bacterium]